MTDPAALRLRDQAQGDDPRTAPHSCPHCHSAEDCTSVAICRAVAEVRGEQLPNPDVTVPLDPSLEPPEPGLALLDELHGATDADKSVEAGEKSADWLAGFAAGLEMAAHELRTEALAMYRRRLVAEVHGGVEATFNLTKDIEAMKARVARVEALSAEDAR